MIEKWTQLHLINIDFSLHQLTTKLSSTFTKRPNYTKRSNISDENNKWVGEFYIRDGLDDLIYDLKLDYLNKIVDISWTAQTISMAKDYVGEAVSMSYFETMIHIILDHM